MREGGGVEELERGRGVGQRGRVGGAHRAETRGAELGSQSLAARRESSGVPKDGIELATDTFKPLALLGDQLREASVHEVYQHGTISHLSTLGCTLRIEWATEYAGVRVVHVRKA
ncbi:hypothetical protein GCM10011490_01970 [Pseudoclavibacter endophyticus]|nr:hypothetical protein GCM10011490_01970 [Pseudoclavibacter endophyticus]